MKLYVGNLAYSVTESDLSTMFGEFGEVLSAKVITDRFTGKSKGFGFVEMANKEQGESAIAALNGKSHDSRDMVVNEARPQAKKEFKSGPKRW